MVMSFKGIAGEIPKIGVWRCGVEDDVLIAELTFTSEDFKISPTPGRSIEPQELRSIGAYAEMRLRPRKTALKGWKTRRTCQQLRALYALEDPREASRALTGMDDSGSFLELLYSLTDSRSLEENWIGKKQRTPLLKSPR